MRFVLRAVLTSLAVALAPSAALAQQSMSSKEKAAANIIAKYIQDVRSQNKLPHLRRIRDGHLRVDACRRAGKGDKSLDERDGITPEKVGTLSALWYSTSSPTEFPPQLTEWAKGPDQKYEQPHRFAVGVCLVNESNSTTQRYYIDVGNYMSAIKSILNMPTWD